jgi:hypothetical protein
MQQKASSDEETTARNEVMEWNEIKLTFKTKFIIQK